MENNNIVKICPYCKNEIKEGDEVKVCPVCDIPHHTECWEENKGCTTFGCSEQHYEAQGTNPTAVCSNCGAPMGDDQAFCPKCGTKKAADKKLCSQCGFELIEGQDFCPRCGTKSSVEVALQTNAAIDAFNANITNGKKKKSKLVPVIIAVIIVAILAVLVLPKILITPEKLMAEGNFAEAYEKADAVEKPQVKATNAVAVCSAMCVDVLKDSASFDLRDAWYDSSTGAVTLKVAGNNSYGNTVINYWYYTWDDEDYEYTKIAAVSSFEEETIYSWDDTDERIEKILNNSARLLMQRMMVSSNELTVENVQIINNLFYEGILDDVLIID